MCEVLGESKVFELTILVICFSYTMDVLSDLLYLIVVEDKEASRDNNDVLILKEREVSGQ